MDSSPESRLVAVWRQESLSIGWILFKTNTIVWQKNIKEPMPPPILDPGDTALHSLIPTGSLTAVSLYIDYHMQLQPIPDLGVVGG